MVGGAGIEGLRVTLEQMLAASRAANQHDNAQRGVTKRATAREPNVNPIQSAFAFKCGG